MPVFSTKCYLLYIENLVEFTPTLHLYQVLILPIKLMQ